MTSMQRLQQLKKHSGHEFVRSLLYGPVNSRRYGRSLGINLLPIDRKVCSFNCVYCQLGWNPKDKKRSRCPSFKTVANELKRKLPDILNQGLDTIALSGNGEPTLYPQFGKVIALLQKLIGKSRQKPKLICLTNGTKLADRKIRHALSRLDECCLKVDANCPQVNLPCCGFDRQKLLQYAAELKNLVVQSCFFDGCVSNIDKQSVHDWIEIVTALQPKRVDLYTISRRTPLKGLRALSEKQLYSIATRLRRRLSVNVRVCL